MTNNMVIYYDVNTNYIYNEFGTIFGAELPKVYLDNTVALEIHYVIDTTAEDPAEWTPWTGLSGIGVSSTLAFDTDYLHAVEGSLSQATSSDDTQIQVTTSIDEVMLNTADTLILYRNDRVPVAVPYQSFIVGDGFITFNLIEPIGESFSAGASVRVPQALLLKVEGDNVDISNAQNGVFIFNAYIMSYRILKALDYSDTDGLSGILEHKITSDGNTINTFHIPFFVANMMDFETTAEIPETSTKLVTTEYVDSKVSAAIGEMSTALIMQYSSDGESWHDTYTLGDVYVRRKTDNDYAVWSGAELLAPVELVVKSIDYTFTTTDGQEAEITFTKEALGISDSTEPNVSLWSVGDNGKIKANDTTYTAMWTTDSLVITYQTTWAAGTWTIKLA